MTAKKFEEFDQGDWLLALDGRQRRGSEEAFDYYDGNHWRDGDGWRGPQFRGNDPSAQIIKEGVKNDFTSQNATRSGVRRHRRGVLGRVPGWIVTPARDLKKLKDADGKETTEKPTEQEQALIDEAYAVLKEWWTERSGLDAFKRSLTNRLVGGRGPLAFYIPPSELVTREDGAKGVRVSNPREAARKIYALTPRPSEAAVVTHPVTMRPASVRRVVDGSQNHVEVSFVAENGNTVVTTVRAGGSTISALIEMTKRFFLGEGDAGGPGTYEIPLGRRLMIVEMEGEELVTEQVRQNQALIAKGLTMLSHNMDLAGFRERTYINIQPAGDTVEVADPNVPGGKRKVFIPATMPVGPGARPIIEGKQYTDTDSSGKKITRLADPKIVDTDPIPTKSFEDTTRIGRRNVLDEMDQLHVEISSEASASGESHVQSRHDYKKSLDETKLELDRFGSAAFETVLALVAYLSGKPGRYDALRVSFNSHVDPGPLAAAARTAVVNEKKERLRSREDAMESIGIDDPDAMRAKIDEEEREERLSGIHNDNGNEDKSPPQKGEGKQ